MIVVERIITGRFKLSYIENETTKYVWRDGAQLFNTGRVIESVASGDATFNFQIFIQHIQDFYIFKCVEWRQTSTLKKKTNEYLKTNKIDQSTT